jgi:hypothetical protein
VVAILGAFRDAMARDADERKPEPVIGWHRAGIRPLLAWKSKRHGRPAIKPRSAIVAMRVAATECLSTRKPGSTSFANLDGKRCRHAPSIAMRRRLQV